MNYTIPLEFIDEMIEYMPFIWVGLWILLSTIFLCTESRPDGEDYKAALGIGGFLSFVLFYLILGVLVLWGWILLFSAVAVTLALVYLLKCKIV